MNAELLSKGIYSIASAARLVGVSPNRLRFWIVGRPTMHAAPIVKSEYRPVRNRVAISFLNLIEARFIAAFSSCGVSVRSMRYMAEEARRFLDHPHPFATDFLFRTDGKAIFIETVEKTAEKTGDPKLYDLRGRNWAFHQVLATEFKRDVLYGPSGLAEIWYPRKESAPDVLVHPKIAFGSPSLQDTGVPTEALYEAFAVENDYEAVARWFDVPTAQVKEAVHFESHLRKTLH